MVDENSRLLPWRDYSTDINRIVVLQFLYNIPMNKVLSIIFFRTHQIKQNFLRSTEGMLILAVLSLAGSDHKVKRIAR